MIHPFKFGWSAKNRHHLHCLLGPHSGCGLCWARYVIRLFSPTLHPLRDVVKQQSETFSAGLCRTSSHQMKEFYLKLNCMETQEKREKERAIKVVAAGTFLISVSSTEEAWYGLRRRRSNHCMPRGGHAIPR